MSILLPELILEFPILNLLKDEVYKMKKCLRLFLMLFAVSIISCGDDDKINIVYQDVIIPGEDVIIPGDTITEYRKRQFEIISPYANVEWDTFGHYKAALHVHTINSDGSGTMGEVVNLHYSLDYDLLAITDHVWHGTDGSRPYLDLITRTWTQESWTTTMHQLGGSGARTTPVSHISQERLDEVQTGVGRNGRGMLMIPHTAELAPQNQDELNVFFFQPGTPSRPWGSTLRGAIQEAHDNDAICFINHPGRTTQGMNYPVAGAECPYNPSRLENWITRYAEFYMDFPITTLTGMEIFNRRDIDSRHDRILWDNVNTRTIPEGRFVWGYGNDDLHSTNVATALGSNGAHINYNVMVMPYNSVDNFRAAMVNGHSYIVTVCAYNEGVNVLATFPWQQRPYIESITTGPDSITIVAGNANRVVWISEGRTILETTDDTGSFTIRLTDADIIDQVGVYVRANIFGNDNGMAVIQPIRIIRKPIEE
jgi:hypothetical protein